MKEFDLVVIGSGPGGYVAAIRAAQNGLRTACVEKGKLGGTCLNVGCIPSKSLLQSSEMLTHMRQHGKEHGLEGEIRLNFETMMQRKNRVVASFNSGIKGLFQKNKVTSIEGSASFIDPMTIKVGDETIRARHFILATGSEPIALPFLPFDEKRILSSTGALSLSDVPKKMIVVGAGVIGVELGSVYQRLGAQVHFIEFLDRICPTLDKACSLAFQKILEKQGLTFQLNAKVRAGKVGERGVALTVQSQGGEEIHEADVALLCIGRRPYTEGLNLAAAQIVPDSKGFIPINASFQTAQPHIYAIGDLVDGPMLAHKASEEGILVADWLIGKPHHIHYINIPNVIYTHPEVASVGFTEEQLKERSYDYAVGQFPLKANSRAGCMGEGDGFVKLISDRASGTLLGMHIIAPHAGELIHEGALALEKKATVQEIAATSHAHPTLAEAIKEAAHACFEKPIHM